MECGLVFAAVGRAFLLLVVGVVVAIRSSGLLLVKLARTLISQTQVFRDQVFLGQAGVVPVGAQMGSASRDADAA